MREGMREGAENASVSSKGIRNRTSSVSEMLSLGLVILCVTSVAGFLGPSAPVPYTGMRLEQGYRQADPSAVFYGVGSRWQNQGFREAEAPVGYIVASVPVNYAGGRPREAEIQAGYVPNVLSGYAGGRPREADITAGYISGRPREADAPAGYIGARPREVEMPAGYFGWRPREADTQVGYAGGRPREADMSVGYFRGRPREEESQVYIPNAVSGYFGGRPREAEVQAGYVPNVVSEYNGGRPREADIQDNYASNVGSAYIGGRSRDQQGYRESHVPLFQKQLMPPVLPQLFQGMPLFNLLGQNPGTQNQPQQLAPQQNPSQPVSPQQQAQNPIPNQAGNYPQRPEHYPPQPGYPPYSPNYFSQTPNNYPGYPGYLPQQPGYAAPWNAAGSMMGVAQSMAQDLGLGSRARFQQGKGSEHPPMVCSTIYSPCPCGKKICCCLFQPNQINGFRTQEEGDIMQLTPQQAVVQQAALPMAPQDQQLISPVRNSTRTDTVPAKASDMMAENQLAEESKLDEQKIK